MKHGGNRTGAGRPATPLDERRMLNLVGQGISQREIAERFGLTKTLIYARLRKLRKKGSI